MRLTQEESRALAFIGGMVLLSILGRWVDRPKPLSTDLTAINLDSFEVASAAVHPRRAGERRARKTESATAAPRPRAAAPRIPRAAATGDSTSGSSRRRRVAMTDSARMAVRDRASIRGSARETAPLTSHTAIVHLTPVAPRAPPDRAVERSTTARVINLNTATMTELEQLPRVGKVLAGRIIAYRERVGRFANVDGLVGVKGVGPAMLERLRPYVRAP